MTFSEKLKQARKQKQLTQKEAAAAMGLPFRTYQQYEIGNTYPRRTETYQTIARFYGVPVDYLISTEDEVCFEPSDDLNRIVAQVGLLFSGGQYSESDKDKVMAEISELYFEAKNCKSKEKNSSM